MRTCSKSRVKEGTQAGFEPRPRLLPAAEHRRDGPSGPPGLLCLWGCRPCGLGGKAGWVPGAEVHAGHLQPPGEEPSWDLRPEVGGGRSWQNEGLSGSTPHPVPGGRGWLWKGPPRGPGSGGAGQGISAQHGLGRRCLTPPHSLAGSWVLPREVEQGPQGLPVWG